MKIYLVGGAVRDELLGLPHKEKDWVVVGATVEEMLTKGYKPVGKDFPVFLHPKTSEEYALARTERKVGLGYKGFTFNAAPEVTLEEDLARRDLTINAMAKDGDKIIDPFHGQEDLKNKMLRHVSPAFVEDPVRILRIARFAARFGFTIAPETTELMKEMVKKGEVNALVAERVWKELERALSEKNPENFFAVLKSCGALEILFPQNLAVNLLQKSHDPLERFAILLHLASEQELREFCDRYRVPSEYRDLALLVIRFQNTLQLFETPEQALDLLQSVDAFRREDRFYKFLSVSEICLGETLKTELLKKYFNAAKNIKIEIEKGLSGIEIGDKIRKMRIQAIQKLI